jgi:myo-inositol-1(or 4)-monophosphatase
VRWRTPKKTQKSWPNERRRCGRVSSLPAGRAAGTRPDGGGAGANAVLAGRNIGLELDVSNKGDAGDWVTAFDLAAETAVRNVITGARPDDVITGEEHVEPSFRPTPSGYRWSIDPLDGTTNFIRNIVYYGNLRGCSGPRRRVAGRRRRRPGPGPRVLCILRGHGRVARRAGRADAALRAVSRAAPVRSCPQASATTRTCVRSRPPALGSSVDGFADVRRLGSAALDLCLVADGNSRCLR